MPIKTQIRKLVQTRLTNPSSKDKIVIGKITRAQCNFVRNKIGIDLQGSERLVTADAIWHTISEHGSEKKEKARGQIAVNIDDFELLPSIFSAPDNIEYLGKNKRNQDVFRYTKRINQKYFVVEALRVSSRGNVLEFTTMYKRK